MKTEILVAILSMIGTLGGTFGGILISNRLSNYRIKQLEIKVDKHNSYANRLPVVENDIEKLKNDVSQLDTYSSWASATAEQIKVINHRINRLESKIG